MLVLHRFLNHFHLIVAFIGKVFVKKDLVLPYIERPIDTKILVTVKDDFRLM